MLIKSPNDIRQLKTSGQLLGRILETLAGHCQPGVSSAALDKTAERLIIQAAGRPAFKGYQTPAADRPFPATLCVSRNAELVHGIPGTEVRFKDGDIVSLDIGMEWPAPGAGVSPSRRRRHSGVFTDTAITVAVGAVPTATARLLDVTKQALEVGIQAAQPGSSVAAIGRAIETYVKSQGPYGIVRDLVGHGVGHKVHEQPYIPNYYDRNLESVKLKPGMVIAIEPMISLGGWQVTTMPDGWTIKMADNSLSAHFEHTVIITAKGNVVVTRRPDEKGV